MCCILRGSACRCESQYASELTSVLYITWQCAQVRATVRIRTNQCGEQIEAVQGENKDAVYCNSMIRFAVPCILGCSSQSTHVPSTTFSLYGNQFSVTFHFIHFHTCTFIIAKDTGTMAVTRWMPTTAYCWQ